MQTSMLDHFNLVLVILAALTGALWLADAARRSRLRRAGREIPARPAWLDWSIGWFPFIVGILVLRSFLFEPYKVPSGSMKPNLVEGDYIAVNKFAYGLRLPVINTKIAEIGAPQRGDVMVFRFSNDPVIYIKRVVGLPGDRIVYADKRLTVNGVAAAYAPLPDYADDTVLAVARQEQEGAVGAPHRVLTLDGMPAGLLRAPEDFPHRSACSYDARGFDCTVPAGHYFMMGDHRDNSIDSRYKGFVPEANIVGKAQLVWMNLGQLSRIGTQL